jgi:DNA-binding NarL/FixJ family response regulator
LRLGQENPAEWIRGEDHAMEQAMRMARLIVELPEDVSVGCLRELLDIHGIHVQQCEAASRPAPSSPLQVPSVQLTPTEFSVLRAFTCSDTIDQIAATLGISPGTVKFHTENLYRKLRVGSRAFAVGRALRLGVLTLQDLTPPPDSR